jgi:hypothetical protein
LVSQYCCTSPGDAEQKKSDENCPYDMVFSMHDF